MGERDDAPTPLPETDGWEAATAASLVDPDALFDALADPTRRRVVQHLVDAGDATVEELADVVVGWELADNRVVDADERNRIAVVLHHRHLPKLDDAGLLHYGDDGAVSVAPLPPPVRDVVGVAAEYAALATRESE